MLEPRTGSVDRRPHRRWPSVFGGRWLHQFAAPLMLLLLAGCASAPEPGNLLPVRCLDKPDPGPCKAREPRYYYDYPRNSCRTFYYGGCRGHVPFETREACEDACVAGSG